MAFGCAGSSPVSPTKKMTKKILTLLIVLAVPTFLSSKVSALTKPFDGIQNFTSDIQINRDGTIDVQETIVYYFPTERHGIFRKIPLTKTNQDGKPFKMSASGINVTNPNGEAYQYQDDSTSNLVSLKIGDPDVTFQGTRTYVIRYTISGAITYFSDHDELYWNITGLDWEVPIKKVTANITLPRKEVALTGICYTGAYNATDQNCAITETGSQMQFATTEMLGPHEGLTVATSFPRGIVEILEPVEDLSSFWERLIEIVIIIVGVTYYTVLPIILIVRAIKKLKKQPEEKRVVAAWFDPPKTPSGRDLTAGEVGILHDKKGDVRDITATLIQLAQKGYIRIKSDDKSKILKKPKFTIVKTKEWDDDSLLEYEKYLLESIFLAKDQVNDEVKLSDLGKRTGFARKLQKTYKEIVKQLLSDKMFEEDPYKVKDKWSAVMLLGFFIFNPLLLIAAFMTSKSAKRTPAGGAAWAVIESMRNFVKSQERQLEFQAKNQMFFEKLLPFAIALGVEKIWIERFKDIGLTQPGWLETKDFTVFSYMYLMSNFNSSVSSAVSMSSSRSSSGFSSGFSGGGFSGGGGGGGGGGSW